MRVPALPENPSPGCRTVPLYVVGDKFPYRGIGSSRLDCDDDVRHLSHLVLRKDETRTGENVCGGMDDKIDDICELMKGRQLNILCVNETKRKGNGGAIKRGSFDIYWVRTHSIPTTECK
ncbi:hypothetical protein EVAR_63394_1 [Eumeta japonica]|uniref:Uncharacterized protein n=1 Tax=Eumeta variegata TaxID=151549 RepID=A0A4C1Z0N2_EUMVA|nr:hypothetical protein EVAR_63394_1 [Eumeta japonica]